MATSLKEEGYPNGEDKGESKREESGYWDLQGSVGVGEGQPTV